MIEDVAAKTDTQLSSDAIDALRWIKDIPHNTAEWMINGREVKNEPREKWTHIELSSTRTGRRLSIALAVWKEIGPYVVVAQDDLRMWAPTPDALKMLKDIDKVEAIAELEESISPKRWSFAERAMKTREAPSQDEVIQEILDNNADGGLSSVELLTKFMAKGCSVDEAKAVLKSGLEARWLVLGWDMRLHPEDHVNSEHTQRLMNKMVIEARKTLAFECWSDPQINVMLHGTFTHIKYVFDISDQIQSGVEKLLMKKLQLVMQASISLDRDHFLRSTLEYVHPNGVERGILEGSYMFDIKGKLLSKRLPDQTLIVYNESPVATPAVGGGMQMA